MLELYYTIYMKILYYKTTDPRVKDFQKLVQTKYPQFLIEKHPDLILVAGGDGHMLHAMHDNRNYNVPFFGKARGTVNFFMNHFNNSIEVLEGLRNDKIQLYMITLDSIKVHKNGKCIGEAVNDVIVGDSINGYHEFSVTSQDKSFNSMKIHGSGICISTPLGSTGYNFNNFGPILPISSKLWVMTDIVCNKMIKDIISPQEIRIQTKKSTIFLDGIQCAKIDSDTFVTLSPGASVTLAFLNEQNFIEQRIELSHRHRHA